MTVYPLATANIPNFNIAHSKQSKHLLLLHQNDDLKWNNSCYSK